MKIPISGSTIEKLLYGLLLLVFVGLIIVGIVLVQITHKLNANQEEIKQSTSQIQTQVSCISDFFLQPNRTNITLNNLSSCNTITK